MTGPRRPPRLIVKTTIAVTLVTVVLLLLVVFVVTLNVREHVRQGVTASLESTQRLFAALETRRQREMRAQAATLAESPTLKAALDTYAAYAATADEATRRQLIATITNELEKVSTRIEADALVLVDARQTTLAAAGTMAERWQTGRWAGLAAGGDAGTGDGVVHLADHTFRVVSVPLVLTSDTVIGTLYITTSLDRAYARALQAVSRADVAIVADGRVLAATLGPQQTRSFELAIGRTTAADGTLDLGGESHAFRKLFSTGDTSIYALSSIDEVSGPPTRQAMRNLAFIAVGATLLALAGSFRLARQLTRPIGQLSASLQTMAAAHKVGGLLPRTGSSCELDTLTDTFNALMTSLAAAEEETEAAYTGAIRALAMALDARDPYTAGHSDRVSVLSVAIGRELQLPHDELEVLRLGALLHDIGKIGIPDQVLRKPAALTASEYEAVKEHPVVGARILRTVPFLSPHIPIVELHHERPDGRGYPRGLRGDDIPLAARIVHVADAYDAMTSARAYRRAMPGNDALRELWRCAGTEFHADIVGALAKALPALTSEPEPRNTEYLSA